MPAWDEFDRPGTERSPEELKRIVRYQRWLIAVVLGQLALWLGYIGLVVLSGPRRVDVNFPVVLTVVLGAVGAVFVFLMSWELRGGLAAAVFGLATMVPCMGLLIITLVNGYATTELRKHGVKVGVFGASPADVDHRPTPYDVDDDAGW